MTADTVDSVCPCYDTWNGRCDLEINGEVVVTMWAPKQFAHFQMVVWTAQECMRRGLSLAHTLAAVREHGEA